MRAEECLSAMSAHLTFPSELTAPQGPHQPLSVCTSAFGLLNVGLQKPRLFCRQTPSEMDGQLVFNIIAFVIENVYTGQYLYPGRLKGTVQLQGMT